MVAFSCAMVRASVVAYTRPSVLTVMRSGMECRADGMLSFVRQVFLMIRRGVPCRRRAALLQVLRARRKSRETDAQAGCRCGRHDC